LLTVPLSATPAAAGVPTTAPTQQRAAASQQGSTALAAEAVYEYTTMSATRYQGALRVDPALGTYFYDCVGFVTYALGRAAPQAHATLLNEFHIAPGLVASPNRYVALFGQLDGTQPGWAPVTRVADLQAGDVVAWAYTHPLRSRGHALVIANPPEAISSTQYLVDVWDSSATPHGPNDTRLTNAKNLPGGRNSTPSGLGRGQMLFDVAADGSLLQAHWTTSSPPVGPATYGMARPIS